MSPPPKIDDRHAAVGAWFLGPRAENFDILKEIFESTLQSQEKARVNLFKGDPAMITSEMQATDLFKQNIENLRSQLLALSGMLAEHSVPFWSPRYQAHMLMESSIPAIIGCKCSVNPELFVSLDLMSARPCQDAVQSEQCRNRSQSAHYYDRDLGWQTAVCNARVSCEQDGPQNAIIWSCKGGTRTAT